MAPGCWVRNWYVRCALFIEDELSEDNLWIFDSFDRNLLVRKSKAPLLGEYNFWVNINWVLVWFDLNLLARKSNTLLSSEYKLLIVDLIQTCLYASRKHFKGIGLICAYPREFFELSQINYMITGEIIWLRVVCWSQLYFKITN